MLSRFPVAFRLPAFASRVIPFPPGELGLPHGRLTEHQFLGGGPRRGYHVPHSRVTTGLGAPSTPGTGGALLTECRARPAPAASQRPVPTPRLNVPPRGATIHEASTKVHAIHPSGLPSPVTSTMGRRSFGFPLGSAPRRHQQRTPKKGPGIEHAPGTTPPTSRRSSQLRVHSQSATSCRNGRSVNAP